MLELFGIEGSKRLAAIKEAEAEEIKRHNASRKKAFESTVNRKRLKVGRVYATPP
jgi:flagellar motor switch protein FliG